MKGHYFLICAVGVRDIQGTWNANISVNRMTVSKEILEDCLRVISSRAGVDRKSLVISSVSYLGEMTKEEFEGEE